MKTKEFVIQKKISDFFTLEFRFNHSRMLGYFSFTKDSLYYPVYDGRQFFFDLPDANNWLKKQWKKATQGIELPSLYLGKVTEMKHNKQVTWLTNNYCPICLRQKSYFENHHCVGRAQNGPDGYKNVLRICATCHAIITRGCLEERWPMSNAALFHQIMCFGADVFPRNFRKIDMEEYEQENRRKANFEDYLQNHDKKTDEEKDKSQAIMMEMGLYFYQFFRDVVCGTWSWKKAAKLYPKIHEQFREAGLIKA